MNSPPGQAEPGLRQLLQSLTQRLAAVGCASPRLDAELLLAHVLDRPRSWLFAHPEHRPGAAELERLDALLARRIEGQPMAHLLGEREFWSLPFSVTPATLIPRPDTETTVELALERIPGGADWQILDLGTGCGVIALVLARERPECRVTATERSPEALAVAARNRTRLGLDRVELLQGDWFAPLAGRRFDLIISNPPYVAAGDPHLHNGDPRFDPPAALVAGPAGPEALAYLIETAPDHLAPSGWLVLEHGYDQAPEVSARLAARGYSRIECRRDLGGQPRATAAQYIINS